MKQLSLKQKITWFLTIIILQTFCAVPTLAMIFPDKPKSGHYYVDGADMIRPHHAEQIDIIVKRLMREEKKPIIVVTIPSLAAQQAKGIGIENYARALFDYWGIGSKTRNDGVLLLISKLDRKVHIELGAGYARRFDVKSDQIMQSVILHKFKKGEFSVGIRNGVQSLNNMVRGINSIGSLRALKHVSVKKYYFIVMGLFLILLTGSLIMRGKRSWAWQFTAFLRSKLAMSKN